MKKFNLKKSKIFYLFLILTVTFFSKMDTLKAQNSITQKINVTQKIKNATKNEKVSYILEGLNENSLFNGEKKYKFSLEKNEKKTLDIDIKKTGSYIYKIYPIEGENIVLSKKVYTIKIDIIKTNDTLKLSQYTIIDNENFKTEDILFIHEYKEKTAPKDKDKPKDKEKPKKDKPKKKDEIDITKPKIEKGKILRKMPNTAVFKNTFMYLNCIIIAAFIIFIVKKKREEY